MAHLAGVTGSVYVSATGTGIKAWSADYTSLMVETTDFADIGKKTYLWAGSEWAGSFDGYKDGLPLAMGTVAVELRLHEQLTGLWTGSAFITGIHPNVSFDGIVSYSYDFQGTGPFYPPTV